MKKNILIIGLICIFAIGLTSCGKNKEKTNTEKLCNEKGWVLQSATAAPYYKMSTGEKITDVYTYYLRDHERDEIIFFNSDGSEIIDPGTKLPKDDEEGYTQRKAALWSFNGDETTLTFQIPFFYSEKDIHTYNDMQETATIVSLTKDELTLNYTFNVVDKKEQCTFTLTYKLAN